MLPANDTDYKSLFSQLIKKQMLVLGPDITLAKVKNVIGLTVDINGDVQKIDGDPQQMLQALINQFVELSGMIVKKTMESILTSYPGMMAMATASAFSGEQVVTQGEASTVSAQTSPESPKPDAVEVTASTDSQQSLSSSQPSETSSSNPEPPSIDTIQSGSPAVDIVKKEEPPIAEPQPFSSKEMDDLNKALEELSKAPLSTENTQSGQGTV